MKKKTRKTRIGHDVPDELETKIIACFKQITFQSISRILEINEAKIYRTLRKFQIPVKPHSKVDGTKYGKKEEKEEEEEREVKFKSNHSRRLTKPFKTSQL